MVRGEQFSSSLKNRLRGSAVWGVKGASTFAAALGPIQDIKAMGEGIYFESKAGQIDLMATALTMHLATGSNPWILGAPWS